MKPILLLVMTLVMGSALAQPASQNLRISDPLEGRVHGSISTADQQTNVAITIYNNNLALVRDTRDAKLLPGEVSLTFMDVAQQIRPETVSLRSVSAPGSLRILEQNYEFDLMSPTKMMEKYVGQEVQLLNFSKDIGFSRVSAELLSLNEGPIYRVDNQIYLDHPGTVVLPRIPENLIAKPSLVWALDNDGTDHAIEVTYLTGGVSWKADYVLTLAQDSAALDIAAWVTLNNQSGAQYNDARLKLVAGEVNMVRPERAQYEVKAMMRGAAADVQMAEESFAEYHLYTLARPTTIKHNQSKQVSLFSAAGIHSEKIYEFRGNAAYYSQRIGPVLEQKVGVFLEFMNESENQLGIPLPAGIMRVYQPDSEGMLQFAGEDRLKHTPKDEKVRLRLGNAFDVVGERVQTDFEQVARTITESAYTITLRNHKEEDIVVNVVEPMTGEWRISGQSHDFKKKDARTALFPIAVPADGETVLTYRVRVKY